MNSVTKKIVYTAMFASLICVATMIIKIPSPLKGYVNLGDAFVLLGAWVLSPIYGMFAAGIGSALADIFSGYVVYAPVTFVIKALMSIVAYTSYNLFSKKIKSVPSRIIAGLFAEILMILGYFVFEGFMYGFAPSLVNIPFNAIQGIVGIIVAVLLIKVIEKTNIFKDVYNNNNSELKNKTTNNEDNIDNEDKQN